MVQMAKMEKTRALSDPEYYWEDPALPYSSVYSLADVLMQSTYFDHKSGSGHGVDVVIFTFVGDQTRSSRTLSVEDFIKRYNPVLKSTYKLSKSRV